MLVSNVFIFSEENIDIDLLSAKDELKWAINAYHRGLFNESIRGFEKALSYKPENAEIQEWLALAWYRSGFTDSAISLWNSIVDEKKAILSC